MDYLGVRKIMSAGYDLVKGLKVTFKELFKKSVTDKYPKEFRNKPQRFHGRHVLNKYEDGMEKCIGCELCAGVCPAQCIYRVPWSWKKRS